MADQKNTNGRVGQAAEGRRALEISLIGIERSIAKTKRRTGAHLSGLQRYRERSQNTTPGVWDQTG